MGHTTKLISAVCATSAVNRPLVAALGPRRVHPYGAPRGRVNQENVLLG